MVNIEDEVNKEKTKKNKKICVVGLGYIGLPTASMLANHGYKVVGVDIDENKVNAIKNGTLQIEEPGLETLVRGAINSGNLIVKTTPEEADIFIICVPTPAIEDNGTKKCDLSYVWSAAKNIKPYLKKGNLVIIESTIPPNTTNQLHEFFGEGIYVAHCPERVLPGKILMELVENDRIIGGVDEKSAELAKEIYQSFVDGNIYLTDATTAEMVKLMENTFRDVNIALANEFAKVCEEIGVNVWEAIELANKHPRVNILKPGPGVGGHCISIDPWFIVEKSKNAKLIKAARELNDKMPEYVYNLILREVERIENPKIAILGVTYKGNVDDTRESPAKKIVSLLSKKFVVKCYDPHAKVFDYELCSLETCVENADCMVVLADHNEFRNFDEDDIKYIYSKMRTKKIIDTKNILNHSLWKKYDFDVVLLGDGKRFRNKI